MIALVGVDDNMAYCHICPRLVFSSVIRKNRFQRNGDVVNFRGVQSLYESSRTTVFRAQLVNGDREVVCKAISRAHASTESAARLRWEYDVLRDLNLIGIPQIIEFEDNESSCALYFDDTGGESLDRILHRDGPVESSLLVEISIQIVVLFELIELVRFHEVLSLLTTFLLKNRSVILIEL